MDNFWSKIDKRGDEECWPWLAAKDKNGYGLWQRPRPARKGTRRSARIVWEEIFGPIPYGLIIMHTCDNPLCCNPKHLRLGTYAENTHDAMAKGRLVNPPRLIGEANPGGRKLTEEQVRDIRRKYVPRHYGLERLAVEYGVTFGMVGHIVKRRAWRHVA